MFQSVAGQLNTVIVIESPMSWLTSNTSLEIVHTSLSLRLVWIETARERLLSTGSCDWEKQT